MSNTQHFSLEHEITGTALRFTRLVTTPSKLRHRRTAFHINAFSEHHTSQANSWRLRVAHMLRVYMVRNSFFFEPLSILLRWCFFFACNLWILWIWGRLGNGWWVRDGYGWWRLDCIGLRIDEDGWGWGWRDDRMILMKRHDWKDGRMNGWMDGVHRRVIKIYWHHIHK